MLAETSNTIPTVINLVVKDFYDLNFNKMGKHTVNTLMFERFHTEDLTKLSDIEKKEFLLILFEKSKTLFGPQTADSDLEKSIKAIIARYGVTKGYFELLEILPEGVMESERLSVLGRDDLEVKVKERTKELQGAKEELEKRVAERTLELEAERNKFSVVLYNTFDGVFALDKQGRIIAFNKSMEDLTGFLEGEVLGNLADD